MTDDELHDSRLAALELLNDVCVIERSQTVQDGLDETIEWTNHLIGVPCRVAESVRASDYETTQAGRLTSVGDHVVRLPYGTDIHESDRIKVTVNGFARSFDVARIVEHSYATTTTVVCVEAR